MQKLSKEEVDKLWREYKSTNERRIFDTLAENYLPLVKYIAERLAERLPHNVQSDDLLSAGLFGLLEAIDRFDLSRGVKFESYCVNRIRGAMLDELRNMDWVPRLTRQKSNRLEEAYSRLEKNLGRTPTDEELSEYLKISLKELHELYKEVSAVNMLSVQGKNPSDDNIVGMEIMVDKKASEPFTEVAMKDTMDIINKHLSTKERYVFMLYYNDELTMKEIGTILGLSESRVSQIHAKMMVRLRGHLRNRKELSKTRK